MAFSLSGSTGGGGGGSDQLDEATVPVFLFSTDKQLWDMLFRGETTELNS